MRMTRIHRILPLLPLALLCGCENKLTIDLAGGPTDGAQEVVLDLASVTLLTDDDEVVELVLDDADPIDMLAFQRGETFRLTGERQVGSNHYVGIALEFDSNGSFLTEADGDEVDIDTPSTLTFADVDFTIDENDEVRIVLALNLRFSLVDDDSGDYDLDPVLRAVRPGDAGAIGGAVAATIVESSDCRQARAVTTGVAVYVFKGSDVTPADYDGQSNLIDAANVEFDTASGEYRYELHFLPAGAYTLALTCEADADDPSGDDAVTFVDSGNVTVNAGSTAAHDFP
jgi:hypothetical protein